MLATAKSRFNRQYLCHLGDGGYATPHPNAVLPVIGVGEDIDWRSFYLPVRDQLRRGTCFAMAATGLGEFSMRSPEHLSAEYVTWRVQVAEGSWPADVGGSVANALSVLHAWGCCLESTLPYDGDVPNPGRVECDQAAQPWKIGIPCYVDLTNLDAVHRVLAARKGIAVSFKVYENFERTGLDGIVPPRLPSDRLLGGHAEVIVGLRTGKFILRGSWGSDWGDHGYCYVSPAQFVPECFESWTA